MHDIIFSVTRIFQFKAMPGLLSIQQHIFGIGYSWHVHYI